MVRPCTAMPGQGCLWHCLQKWLSGVLRLDGTVLSLLRHLELLPGLTDGKQRLMMGFNRTCWPRRGPSCQLKKAVHNTMQSSVCRCAAPARPVAFTRHSGQLQGCLATAAA